MYIQVMTFEQAESHKDNPFDLTKVNKTYQSLSYLFVEYPEIGQNDNFVCVYHPQSSKIIPIFAQ